MASNNEEREDPFAALQYGPKHVDKKIFIIPPPQGAEDHRFVEKEDDVVLMSFKYDINRNCFEKEKGRLIVKSLFFQLLRQNEERSFSSKNFLVIRFNEREIDDLTIERDRIVENLLRTGVVFEYNEYNYLACSNSQLQKKSFLFMKGSKEECKSKLQYFIDIDSLKRNKGVAKQVKYTGLLFTSCKFIAEIPHGFKETIIADYSNSKYNFTDGCGMISIKLAKEIVKQNPKLKELWKDDIPSVWQVRYYGTTHLCKGILVVDYTNDHSSILSLRESLQKVSVKHNFKKKFLGIVEANLNCNFGKLNKQFITLLSEIMKNELLQLQKDYIDRITQSRFEAPKAVKIAALMGKWSNVKPLLKQRGLDVIKPQVYSSLIQSIEKTFVMNASKEDSEGLLIDRIQIPLACSRLLFGAAYPEKLNDWLQETQCIVMTENGYHKGPVIVSRSPSYALGDIRILKAVQPPDDLQMRNVILFATRGRRPDPDKMSGGDLDGDKYLVIWDERLLKFADKIREEEPFDYEASKSQQNTEDLFSYIAKWENSLLSQIDSCFYSIAEEFGVKSNECRELCGLFSRAVDQVADDISKLRKISARTNGVQKRYQQLIHVPDKNKPLWEQMRENVIETVEKLQTKREKFPSDEEWQTFYSSMVNIDKRDVDELLKAPEVVERLDKMHIDPVRQFWHLMCKGRIDLKPATFQKVLDPCMYDCDVKDCTKFHSDDPIFHKNEWRKKCNSEIMEVIGEVIEEFENVTQEIKQHQHKLVKKHEMERKAEEEYAKLIKIFDKKWVPILNVNKVLDVFQRKCIEMNTAIDEVTDPTFFDKVKSFFGDKSFEIEKEKKECTVEALRRQLIEVFNDLSDTLNVMCTIVKIPPHTLDFLDTSVFNQRRIVGYVCEKVQSATETNECPKYKSPPSCVENIEKDVSAIQGHVSDLEHGKYTLTTQMNEMKNEKKNIEMKVNQLKEEMNKNVKFIQNRRTLKDACAVLLDSSKPITEKDLEPIISGLLESGFAEEEKSERLHLLFNSIQHQRKTIINDIKELLVEYYLSDMNVKEIKNIEMQVENLNLDILEKQQKISDHTAKIEKLDDSASFMKNLMLNVYNETRHNKAIEKYGELDKGRIRSFDLALIALHHEVEMHFNIDVVKAKDRIAAAIALNLCIKREKNRCERALSDDHCLPVFKKRSEILEQLREHDAVIVVAHTGSGKSTQVPQYLADDLHNVLQLSNGFPKIVCTQPRRVACIRIAERVSLEYAGQVGLPPPINREQEEKEKVKLGIRRVVAYPLYASLDQAAQDRALDCDDIVGYDRIMRPISTIQQFEKDDSQKKQTNLTDTPGEVGQWIGYHIGSRGKSKQEKKHSQKHCKETRVKFVTEGLLLQQFKSTANNVKLNCIIIDEAHERGKDTDLILAHLHEALKCSKEATYKGINLKIVVMSASIDKEAFSKYFGGCPIVECEGKMHEVKTIHLPPPVSGGDGVDSSEESNSSSLQIDDDSDYDETWGKVENAPSSSFKSKKGNKGNNTKGEMKILVEHAVDVIFDTILSDTTPGHILVFLPGQGEIHDCVDLINERAKENDNKLEGNLYVTKKVVCCTNIAETSLTIPGVRYVIDAGKAKKIRYNHKLRVTTLKLTDISKASAKQREGRAGRVAPGICYRLYSKEREDSMADYDDPAMKETPIDELYLYALDVFKGLEKIELMDDAKLTKDMIQNAKIRLTNLQFIQNNGKEVLITNEGKFAMSLIGDVSLEGSKMIWKAKEYGVVYDALYLSVLMKQCILSNKLQNDKTKEKRAKFTDEIGDHLTNLNLYKHFQRMNASSKENTKRWCRQLGLSYDVLEQVHKVVNRVYEAMKTSNQENIADIFNESKENEKEKHTKIKANECVAEHTLIEKPEELMKAMVSGFFHNIAFLNDAEYVKSGFSLATPANYGSASPDNFDLLKLMIARDSTLHELGDVLKSTPTIFHTLFETQTGFVLMQSCSRIKAEWIDECTSPSWKSSLELTVCNEDTVNHFVKQVPFKYVGPRILARLVKATSEGLKPKIEKFVEENASKDADKKAMVKAMLEKKYLETSGRINNAKVRNLFEAGEVRIYGSTKEVVKMTNDVEPKILTIKSEMVGEDSIEIFPNHDSGMTEVCAIESGLLINSVTNQPRPQIFTSLGQVMSATLIVSKGFQSEQQIEEAVKKIAESLPDHLENVWEKPNITCNEEKEFGRIEFTRKNLASHFERIIKQRKAEFFSSSTHCFIDRYQQIRVRKTSLYPSVLELSKDDEYSSFKVKAVDRKKHGFFKIELKKKAPPSADQKIKNFIRKLAETQVFGSELIEVLDMNISHGVKEYIYWKINQNLITELEETWNVLIKRQKLPTMVFEVFGEYKNRTEAAGRIQKEIKELSADILSEDGVGKYTWTYSKKIKLDSRYKLDPVLRKIEELRKNNENVKITINFLEKHGDRTIPVAHLICEDVGKAKEAENEIRQILECCNKTTDIVRKDGTDPACCICTRSVYIPKSSKHKKREREELKQTRQEKGAISKIGIKSENEEDLPKAFRLTLCGCTYCKNCIQTVVMKQLENQTDKQEEFNRRLFGGSDGSTSYHHYSDYQRPGRTHSSPVFAPKYDHREYEY